MSTHDDFQDPEPAKILLEDLQKEINKNMLRCIFCTFKSLTIEELREHSAHCESHPAVIAGTDILRYFGNTLMVLQWVQPMIHEKYYKKVKERLDFIHKNGLKFLLPSIESMAEKTYHLRASS